ncbi:MAG: hypothetical protein HQK75_14195 [Candidatus Magnetomorum sp.]|nr:hypothetical protein [Candidatus Magnetomorum sp.]
MKYSKCDLCEYKGYSQELCRFHMKKITGSRDDVCGHYTIKRVSKNAAIGAGVGAVAVFAGLAAAPIMGIKAAFGHLIAAKVSAGGVVGAGVNVARTNKKKQSDHSAHMRKKRIVIPFC